MGRKRTRDLDLEPGWRRINGRVYYQPTTAGGRAQRARLAFTVPDGQMVYFIRAKGGAVKIGYTTSKRTLYLRLAMLRVGSASELTFVGAVPGSRDDESRAHRALHLWRRAGEWFGPSRAVTAYLRTALNQQRIPELSNSADPVKPAGETANENKRVQAL